MKQLFITFITLFLLLIAFVACTCNKEENEDYFDEPIDVPFTMFSMSEDLNDNRLPGTSCRWLEFRGNVERNEVIVINNDRELRRHTACVEESDLPVIDFSKYTLLLVRGLDHGVAYPWYVNLQQLSSQSYVVNVRIVRSGLAVTSYWHAAIITDKLDRNTRMRVNVID